ncbi:PRC-barrel domain-containing protein [Floridanema evergladense]|uniref:PRC-barrel domain-containing protein n=1 Tax=Floridaenema evergladense BLCC-F167 TaxID=3153639 RepID=A0ABV4WRG1_9CYAN
MNRQESVIKQSQLINLLAIDRRTAEELGRVDHLWLNTQTHKVIGLTCKAGFLGSSKQRIIWQQIESIGEHSILVNINAEEFANPEKPDEAYTLIGHEVWTDTGSKVGKLVDYLIVPETGAVINYLFTSSGWRGILNGLYILPIDKIQSIGSKRLIVEEATFQEPQFYSEGLNQKVGQFKDFFKTDLEETKRHLDSLAKGAQNIAEQAKDKAQELADRAKEQLSDGQQKSENPALPEAPEIIEIKAELIKDAEEKEKG